MIIVILHGILTPAEYSVCKDKEGLLSVKENRNSLVESGSRRLKGNYINDNRSRSSEFSHGY